ncbi:hypothetical protein F2Q69_00052691 [Brassica cretica]|uniref:Uncharacterized protein n=1 Tax=Brassica cretica TaxID=69181 RepID=A0A8S9MNJ7_BRACR|nr:hypothetical protein F2Q69_00052691 [Brassica cretica]
MRKCTRGNDGESLQQEGLSLTSGFRGKFVSLIDGMISECGFELEVQIGELERDIGKTASSLLKEKIAIKTKSSEVSRLQRRIESGEGSANRGVEEAKDALHVEFQTRLAKISDFLGSLECIRSRDLALATVDGGMALGDLAAVDGSFDLILADLKSECFLPTCSEDPEGQDPAVGENGGGAAPSMDEAMGEGESECFLPTCSEDPEGQDPAVGENGGGAAPSMDEAMGEGEYLLLPCMAMFMFWDWPLVALNPCRFAAFYERMISLRLCEHVLGSRIFDIIPRDVKDQCAGVRARPSTIILVSMYEGHLREMALSV